jgi:hypothetical protein
VVADAHDPRGRTCVRNRRTNSSAGSDNTLVRLALAQSR